MLDISGPIMYVMFYSTIGRHFSRVGGAIHSPDDPLMQLLGPQLTQAPTKLLLPSTWKAAFVLSSSLRPAGSQFAKQRIDVVG